MEPSFTIRMMEETDADAIYRLTREFHSEMLEDLCLFCTEEEMPIVLSRLKSTSMVLIVDNEVVGFLAGFVTAYVLNRKPIYQEVAWYVSKEYRKYGVKLLEHIEEWCMKNGVEQIIMVSLGARDEMFLRFFTRRGYKMLETQYMKNLGGA